MTHQVLSESKPKIKVVEIEDITDVQGDLEAAGWQYRVARSVRHASRQPANNTSTI
jgi:hypothetical protein